MKQELIRYNYLLLNCFLLKEEKMAEKILIIDDDVDTLRIVGLMLQWAMALLSEPLTTV